ncbi:GNAT family N-acetyltransferase [Hymenobacter terrestris]|uniref:N-acetyltransferase n=1 Tax=Hymenobacter terrestris TaxID=2748310 RepID=A0ABX2Q005_9BACT|nr:GNAT family N-acetyltransferase [Hymenobacter terrestris]NVO84133.1 N-acetyltransferase [Hymenobacter terrestris]
MSLPIKHTPENQEFTVSQDGYSAELSYSLPTEGVIDFTHTFVEEGLRGQGIGDELAKAGLAYAREKKLKVRTTCSFMASYVAQHPDYQDLVEAC